MRIINLELIVSFTLALKLLMSFSCFGECCLKTPIDPSTGNKKQCLHLIHKTRVTMNPEQTPRIQNVQNKVSHYDESTNFVKSKSNVEKCSSPFKTTQNNPSIIHNKKSSHLYGGAKAIITRCLSNLCKKQASEGKTGRWTESFSPHCSFAQPDHFKIKRGGGSLLLGGLTGRGKYCHVHLCQEVISNTIFAYKEVYNINQPENILVRKRLEIMSKMNLPTLVNIFKISQNEQKITIIQEYTPSTLKKDLELQQKLPLQTIKAYLIDLIEALQQLHKQGLTINNVHPSQIGTGIGVAKLRPNLTQTQKLQMNDLKSTACLTFEMAYGFIQDSANHNHYNFSTAHKIVSILSTLNKQSLGKQEVCLVEWMLWLLTSKSKISLRNSLAHSFFTKK